MSSYAIYLYLWTRRKSKLLCCEFYINHWSQSYADLRIHLFHLWHPLTATPCREKFNGGSTIDLHLIQIYGLIYFIFDILWQLHPVGTNSMQDQPLVKSSHIGYLKQALKGVFAKNERGYRLNAIKKRFWSLLFLLLSVASIRRNLLKTSHTE